MTVEEKNLLIRDLCCRLAYGVLVEHTPSGIRGALNEMHVKPIYGENDAIVSYVCSTDFFGAGEESFDIEVFKPVLRKLSSMTEEEKEYIISLKYQPSAFEYMNIIICSQEVIKWLNAHHFDYMGLIEMGLAIEAENGTY